MTQSSVPRPSVTLTSFACPRCGAHATQTWFDLYLRQRPREAPVPVKVSEDEVLELEASLPETPPGETLQDVEDNFLHDLKASLTGEPYFRRFAGTDMYRPQGFGNVFVSQCYTCGKPTIWLHDRILYPGVLAGPSPNSDLSEDVANDFEEARSIVDLSPRGAAALLRLAVEKLCIEVGANGKSIDQRIADLVGRGLPSGVQEALDALRVIGNEAVHPGSLDLRDDRDTALKLFDLVNFIAEEMISRPKARKAVYDMIPPSKREGIDRRNAEAKGQSGST